MIGEVGKSEQGARILGSGVIFMSPNGGASRRRHTTNAKGCLVIACFLNI